MIRLLNTSLAFVYGSLGEQPQRVEDEEPPEPLCELCGLTDPSGVLIGGICGDCQIEAEARGETQI